MCGCCSVSMPIPCIDYLYLGLAYFSKIGVVVGIVCNVVVVTRIVFSKSTDILLFLYFWNRPVDIP